MVGWQVYSRRDKIVGGYGVTGGEGVMCENEVVGEVV